MTQSGSYNFYLTRDGIITAAMHKIGALKAGGTPTSDELIQFGRVLNMISKRLQARSSGIWMNKEVILFPQYQTASYTLGPTGDNACLASDAIIGTIDADAAAAALTVKADADTTGILDGEYLGVELDDGTIQWTTANGDQSGTTVTLTAALTGAASSGNFLASYSTKIQRPMEILNCRVYTSSTIETPATIVAREDYMELPSKETDGVINQVAYDPTLDNAILWVWPRPDDVSQYLKMSIRYPIQDFDSNDDTPDFPSEWTDYLVYQLAAEIGDDLGAEMERVMRFETKAKELFDELSGLDRDYGPVRIVPSIR